MPVGQSEAYVTVHVSESDTFTREGFDVHSDAVISFTQAVLGGSVRIQSLNGPLDVKVHVVYVHVRGERKRERVSVCVSE